jgi:hypothetical protein
LPLPAAAVRACLVSAADDLRRDGRVPAHGVADMNEVILMACLSSRSRIRGTPSRAPYS